MQAGMVAAAVAAVALAAAADACQYADPFGWHHTMCKYSPVACPAGVLIKAPKVSCEEKDRIVDLHNSLRQRVATGRVSRQPPATNMRRMVWDDELEALAKRWAEQCTVGHDSTRDVGRFAVGQNVAATWTYAKEPKSVGRAPEWERLINGWFDEVDTVGFDANHIDPFRFNLPAGHYTQMVWADTYAIGCAYSYYRAKDTGYTKLYVCNYGPRGNVIGSSMYAVGNGVRSSDTCEARGEKSSLRYEGLCEMDALDYRNSHCEQDNSVSQNEVVVVAPPPPQQVLPPHQNLGYYTYVVTAGNPSTPTRLGTNKPAAAEAPLRQYHHHQHQHHHNQQRHLFQQQQQPVMLPPPMHHHMLRYVMHRHHLHHRPQPVPRARPVSYYPYNGAMVPPMNRQQMMPWNSNFG